MIPAPSNKMGHTQFRPLPTNEAERETQPFQQKKGRHEANPFQSQIYEVFAAQFNYRI